MELKVFATWLRNKDSVNHCFKPTIFRDVAYETVFAAKERQVTALYFTEHTGALVGKDIRSRIWRLRKLGLH